MIVTALLLFGAPPLAELWVEQPISLPLVISTPSETRGPFSAQDVREAIDAALAREVAADVRQLDGDVLRGCASSVACVLAHREMTRAAEEKAPSRAGAYVLWVTAVATERSVSLSAFIFDLTRVKAALGGGQVKDAELIDAASEVIVPPELLRDTNELRAFAERLVHDQLRPVLEKVGAGHPLGSIRIEGMSAGAEVKVGGRSIGSLIEGSGRIRGVPHGEVSVELSPHELEGSHATLNVGPEEAVFQADFSVPAPARARSWTGWGGAAVLVAGVALATAGSITAATHEKVTCVGGVAADCYLVPNTVPIGVGLAGSGVGLLGGELLFGEWNDWPWPAWIIGSALGVGAGVVAGVAR